MSAPRWQLLEAAAVRATGFPFALLEQLRFPDTVTSVRGVLACERELERVRAELLGERFPSAVARAREEGAGRDEMTWLSRARRAVGRRVPARPRADTGEPPAEPAGASAESAGLDAELARFNELLERREALIASGRAAWAAELGSRRQALRRIFGDARLQEAVFLSSPAMHAALTRYLAGDPAAARSGEVRKVERRLASYLQRVCAKNETQSFFGPINYSRIDSGAPDNLRLRRSAAPLRRRETFASHWMAEELAGTIAREPDIRPHLRPRRSPLCTLDGDVLTDAMGATVGLDPETAELWRLAMGDKTVGELAQRTGRPAEETAGRLDELERRRAVVLDIVVPGDRHDPLGFLEEWLGRLPPELAAARRWREAIAELASLVARFAAASLDERAGLLPRIDASFTALCGVDARRAAGVFYGDRAVLFEECLGDLEECVVGGDLARRITDRLQPVLRLWELHATLLARREEDAARAVWDGIRAPGEPGASLVGFLRAMHAAGEPDEREPDELDALTAGVADLVCARSDGHRAQLRADDLPAGGAAADICPYTSLDVMLAAASEDALRAGDCRIVLGEAHPQALLWVFPTAHFLPDAEAAILAPLEEVLAGSDRLRPAQLAYRRKTKIHPHPLPGETIELSPRRGDCSTIPAAAVEVRDVGGRLALWADDRGLVLHPPLARNGGGRDPLVPLAMAPIEPLDVDLGAHTPRIEIEGLVYQRERWRLPGGSLTSAAEDFDMFLEAWRWKERNELPDEVFVRLSGEPKPVYVDFADFFLVELLEHLARRSDGLTITEMLPASDELWLDGGGGPRCCEFRTIAIRKE